MIALARTDPFLTHLLLQGKELKALIRKQEPVKEEDDDEEEVEEPVKEGDLETEENKESNPKGITIQHAVVIPFGFDSYFIKNYSNTSKRWYKERSRLSSTGRPIFKEGKERGREGAAISRTRSDHSE